MTAKWICLLILLCSTTAMAADTPAEAEQRRRALALKGQMESVKPQELQAQPVQGTDALTALFLWQSMMQNRAPVSTLRTPAPVMPSAGQALNCSTYQMGAALQTMCY